MANSIKANTVIGNGSWITLSPGTIAASGNFSANSISTTGALSAGSISTAGTLSAGSISTAGALSASSISASTFSVGTLSSSSITVSGALSANSISTTLDSSFYGVDIGRGSGAIDSNTAVGSSSLNVNTTGLLNSAFGRNALLTNAGGSWNTAIGADTLVDNTSGYRNTAVGRGALQVSVSGGSNTAIGDYSGLVLTSGSNNTYVGGSTSASSVSVSDEIVVGAGLTGKGTETAYIGGSNGAYNEKNVTTWETTSDRRVKKNIVDNFDGLSVIEQVRVRNFEYRLPEEITDFSASSAVKVKGTQLGVIAQELQQVVPGCVTESDTGLLSVSVDPLLWYLINAVKELSAEVTALKNT